MVILPSRCWRAISALLANAKRNVAWSSLGLGDPCRRLDRWLYTRLPGPFPVGYGDPTRFCTLSEYIGPSVLDATEAGLVTSEIRSSGFAVSCVVSMGSGIVVICFGNNEDMLSCCLVLLRGRSKESFEFL